MQRATVSIRDKSWECYVATTPDELEQGLSGIESIDPETGMLFVLPYMYAPTVTAENMLFDISVVFIDGGLHVTEVVPLLEIGEAVVPNFLCKYFLEVNASEVTGIVPGDTVTITLIGEIESPVPTPNVMDRMLKVVIPVALMLALAKLAAR